MFNVGGGELIVIMLVALIVLGPQRLPGAARQIGKALGDLRRLSSGFQDEVRTALHDADDDDRVAARRNILAKESPPRPADSEIADPAQVAPARREPLRAAPLEATTNGTPVKRAGSPAKKGEEAAAAPETPEGKKPGRAKKTAAKRPTASKQATRRTSSP